MGKIKPLCYGSSLMVHERPIVISCHEYGRLQPHQKHDFQELYTADQVRTMLSNGCINNDAFLLLKGYDNYRSSDHGGC